MRPVVWALIGGVAAAAAGGAWWSLSGSGPGGTGASTATATATADIALGQTLYATTCASCHGANLEGQPDWRSPGADGLYPAPPHDENGHTWHHSDDLLFSYTKLGGAAALAAQGVDFESGMPAFGEVLTDDEIRAILAFIKSTWPDRIRQLQAERSKVETGEGVN